MHTDEGSRENHSHASNKPCESRDEGLGVKRCDRPGSPAGE